MDLVGVFRFTPGEDQLDYSDFDARRLECILSVQHAEADELANLLDALVVRHRSETWKLGYDEFFDYLFHVDEIRISYFAARDCLRLAVQHENQLVRAGFWMSKARLSRRITVQRLDRVCTAFRADGRQVGLLFEIC